MRRKLLQISVLVAVAVWVSAGFSTKESAGLSAYDTEGLTLEFNVPTEEEAASNLYMDANGYNLFLGKTFVGFKEAIGFKESRNNYKTVNEFGYMGKYQFGKGTLQMIGIYNPEEFMNDSKLQEEAFLAYTARNKWILRKDIKRYVGRTMNGVRITESGILAAAHLAGAGNVKKYLRSGGAVGFSDAFGTSISYYLRLFSGYDTSAIQADKQATVL